MIAADGSFADALLPVLFSQAAAACLALLLVVMPTCCRVFFFLRSVDGASSLLVTAEGGYICCYFRIFLMVCSLASCGSFLPGYSIGFSLFLLLFCIASILPRSFLTWFV